MDFGPAALGYDENDITLDWYDYLFLGKQNQFANGKPVKIFVMGENKWRDEDAWPLERAKPTRYFLQLSRQGQQRLRRWRAFHRPRAASEAADNFVYDPANPVPTVGGPLCCDRDPPCSRPTRSEGSREPSGRAGLLHAASGAATSKLPAL